MPEPMLFVFDGSGESKVLVTTGDMPCLPPAEETAFFDEMLGIRGRGDHRSQDGDIWAEIKPGSQIPEGYQWVSRRDLPFLFGHACFIRAGIAYQIMSLHRKNKYCGVCGTPMREHEAERAMECSSCGNLVFPSLSPGVIVAVEKDGMLLMGHGVNFPSGRYSVLAGFVEPGETLEETVAREIYEESRICVKNIRYFGSQPWPFPCSMMLGFTAEWESGDPVADETELTDVRWFAPEDLPDMPPSISISRQLIDDWLDRQREKA